MEVQTRRGDVMHRKLLAKHKLKVSPTSASPFPCQPCVQQTEIVDSGSESDVPLRKKRKLDDNSRASTPRLSTPKGILFLLETGLLTCFSSEKGRFQTSFSG